MFFDLFLPSKAGDIKIDDPVGFKFTGANATLGAVITSALKYLFPIAGLILLFMLIMGGLELMTSAGNPEGTKKGYQKVLWALVGFLLIFLSYWIIQILEAILGIKVF